MPQKIKQILSVLLLLFFTTGCAQQAAFLSNPPGARVCVDGREIGVTPCNYDYQNGSGGEHEVTIEKKGYEPVTHRVEADEVDEGARSRWVKAGMVWSPLWLGAFFTKKLKESYEFILKKEPSTFTASNGVGGEGDL